MRCAPGCLSEGELPAEPIAVLGHSGSARIDRLVHDMVEHSEQAGEIVQGPEAGPAMSALRDFMFERVYLGPAVRAEREKIAAVLRGCSSTTWSTRSCCRRERARASERRSSPSGSPTTWPG